MKLKLTPAEKTNPLLRVLVDGWTEELRVLRARNDGPLSMEETSRLRGQIAQLKAHIALADEAPNV
jgi:hypothetical protein